ncbi:RabGAP/TBC domain-containing protein, partial [Reticulomyxa filosa]
KCERFLFNQGLYDSGLNGSLYLKLHYIQHKLLKHFDLHIYSHFENLGLQPQLYLLRWIRVLFSREFHIDQTIKLWDELFSSHSLFEFIDYISIAMIYNMFSFNFEKRGGGKRKKYHKIHYINKSRDKLLEKKDMSAIAILQNYPKDVTDIQLLTKTARKIQQGVIKLEFDKDLHTQVSGEEISQMGKDARKMLENVDHESFPLSQGDVDNPSPTPSYKELMSNNVQPSVRVPGYSHLSPEDKMRMQCILFKAYRNAVPKLEPLRMGYLIKRGEGKEGIFARSSLKLRWFVIEKERLSYYKNFQAYHNKDESLRPPVALRGRAVRVVDKNALCFEISGVELRKIFIFKIIVSKRAYLLFAANFDDFVLWLHALMFCADKKLNELTIGELFNPFLIVNFMSLNYNPANSFNEKIFQKKHF